MSAPLARPVAWSRTPTDPAPRQFIRELVPLNRYVNRSPL
jgi:hypothetical protein